MKFQNWLYIGVILFSMLMFIYVLLIGLIDFFIILSIFSITGIYFIYYIVLIKTVAKDREKNNNQIKDKNKFSYCWRRMNVIISNMAGGNNIAWDNGWGIKMFIKRYIDSKNRERPFMGVVARSDDTQQYMAVVYDIEADNVVKIVSDPDSNTLSNPFHNFKPFESLNLGGMGSMQNNPFNKYNAKMTHNYNHPMSQFDNMQQNNNRGELFELSDQELQNITNKLDLNKN